MLYHVSLDEIKNNCLIPRIPTERLSGENSTIPRICFSTSIGGALTAIPGNINLVIGLIKAFKLTNVPQILHVYTIRESEIGRENIVKNKTIQSKNLVPDAKVTNETWVINKSIQCQHRIINIQDFCFKSINIDKKTYIYKITKVKYKELDIFRDSYILQKYIDFWNHFRKSVLKKTKNEFLSEMKRELLIELAKRKNK